MQSIPIHKTNILPLRWFANFTNMYVASPFLRRAMRYEDRAFVSGKPLAKQGVWLWSIYKAIDMPYRKWGTTYKIIWDKE
jgi:hypothetical protein